MDSTPSTFIDSFGNELQFHDGWRDRLHAGWRDMLNPNQEIAAKDAQECIHSMNHWIQKIHRVENYLGLFSLSLKGKDLLEIGSYDGATAYALAYMGCKSVTGSDVAVYYINQDSGKADTEEVRFDKNTELANVRESHNQALGGKFSGMVSFIEDDICNSTISNGKYDSIVSWEVLEHITDPTNAFRHMARILRPGGFAFHEYNPFFCISGGHSLSSADFPWGHARLNGADFERMLDEFRPEEKGPSMDFYNKNLNRMSFADLKAAVQNAGLELVSLLPLINQDHLSLVNAEILSQVRNIYPTVGLLDLVAPFSWIVVRKPSAIDNAVYC